jgi:MoaA/NifB/PqqE/SkfB family radical SAM enzyme
MTQQQQQEPSIEDLFQEVQEYCSMIVTEQGNHAVNDNFSMLDSIVFSGEGEPSCRWDDLIELTSMFHNDPTIQRAVKSRNDGGEPSPSLRLTTNGLIDVKNMAMTTAYVPLPSSSVPQFLFDSGITHVSVALMTHDPELYDELVQPSFLNGAKPHSMVCKFIQESVQVPGLDVEVTGVDRQGIVDKSKTEALAASLGVTNPMRWRPYFS